MGASLHSILKNDVFRTFLFYAVVLLVKMSVLSMLTAFYRITKKVFANPEDCRSLGGDKLKPIMNDQDVERIRRLHLNDIENIIPFVLLGIFFCITQPSSWLAIMHFRVFTVSRFIHTVAYLIPIPQPSRALAFGVGFGVNISMAVRTLLYLSS